MWIVRDAATVIMPGIHFQKSVLPDKLDFANPYYKRNDINVIKIPLQVGGFAWKNKYTHLLLTGGPVGTFLLSVDDNPRLNEDDSTVYRGRCHGECIHKNIVLLRVTSNTNMVLLKSIFNMDHPVYMITAKENS